MDSKNGIGSVGGTMLKINGLTVNVLDKYNLLLPSKETIERKKLDDYLFTNNISLNPIMELESADTMLNSVLNGFGIGYILKSVALQNKDLKILELDSDLPRESISLIYDEESIITSTKEFINLLKDNI